MPDVLGYVRGCLHRPGPSRTTAWLPPCARVLLRLPQSGLGSVLSAGAGAGAALCAAAVRSVLGASCGPGACRTAAQVCSQVQSPPNSFKRQLTYSSLVFIDPSHLSSTSL